MDGRVTERACKVMTLHRQVAGHEPDQHTAFEVLKLGRVFVEIEKPQAHLIAVQGDLYAALSAGHFGRCVADKRHTLPVLQRNRRHIRFVVERAIVEVVAELRTVDPATRIETAEPRFHTVHARGRVAHDADHRSGVERGQGRLQTGPTRQTPLRRHNGFIEAHAAVRTDHRAVHRRPGSSCAPAGPSIHASTHRPLRAFR